MSATGLDEKGLIVACPSCGQRNRIAFTAAEARCGKCQAALPAVTEPVEVTSAAAFDALVRESPLAIVVDFWAPWCGPCRMVAPEISRVASAHAGEYLVVKVNTDQVTGLAERFRIQSIPTMAVFRGGREAGRTSGARPAADIEAFVKRSINGA